MILRTSLAVLLLCASAAVLAEGNSVVDDAADAARVALQKDSVSKPNASPVVTGHITATPANPDQVVLADMATREKYLATMRGYYDYRFSGYQYRARVFEWQLFSSRIIFFTVVLLVFAGIYFAAVQFHVALNAARRPTLATQSSATAEDSPLVTHLEISAKGVVVNSSILGVIILVLSLAFFYLYLVYVYPINDTI